jgi:hypothetical protein
VAANPLPQRTLLDQRVCTIPHRCYSYRADFRSFEGKFEFDSITSLADWNNALWDLRNKYGQRFVDKLLYFSFEDWHPPGPDQNVDEFLWSRFDAGLWAVEDNQDKRSDIFRAMKARDLPRQGKQP